jgi:anaerobic ribonucleoside-triphosphate reductase activating protein
MLKYYNSMVVFEEIPDEITLAINITNCPCHCPGCHSKYLWEDIGTELTNDEIDSLIEKNSGITCVCLMGGDSDHVSVNNVAKYMLSKHPGIKVGWYSGFSEIPNEIDINNFDYIKVGPYIEECGGLDKETTNQILYKVEHSYLFSSLVNITNKFWKKHGK